MKREIQKTIFNEWLEAHRGILFKVVGAYAFTAQDKEDLFQEIITQIWNSVPKFKNTSKPSTWIYRVSLYAAMAWSKKEKRHSEQHQSLELVNPLLSTDAPKNPRLDWLYEQIGQLDAVDRSLTLMMLDGYSYDEIATTLGISRSNVGVKLTRLKKHFTQKSIKELRHGI